MIRLKTVVLLLAVIVLAGCAGKVRYDLNTDFESAAPRTVAVLPVDWQTSGGEDQARVGRLFREMSVEKLREMNYSVVPVDKVDKGYAPLADGDKTPGHAATALGTDAVLSISVTDWDESTFFSYASLKLGTRFELYSANGARLWSADYSTKESDATLFDSESVELGVIKAFEPRIQRVVDAVFSSLPRVEAEHREKRYFDWLP